jgi:DME family drug/metabolite transporter
MNEMKKTTPYISILASAVLWGSVGLFFTLLSVYDLSRMEIVFLRTFVAAVLLFLYLIVFNREKLRVRLRDLWLFFGTGIVSLLAFNYCYFSAMAYTSLSVAAVLLYTAPAFVAVLSALFFKDRLTVRKVLALVLTIFGCTVVSGLASSLLGGGVSYAPEGILFGLGAGFGYSLYTIFGRAALKRYDSITISFYTFAFAAVGSGLLCNPSHLAETAKSPLFLLLGVGLSITTCLAPYLLYTYGLKHVGNSEASITATIEPVAAACFSVLLLNEPFTLEKGLGMALILGAVFIINLPRAKRTPVPRM